MKKAISFSTLLIFFGAQSLVLGQSRGFNINPVFTTHFINTIFITALSSGLESKVNSRIIPNSSVKTGYIKELSTTLKGIERFNPLQFKYAMLLDVTVETLANSSLYKFIDNWFGTRYRMGGNSKRGIDCSAFTSTLLSAVYSLSSPRTAHEQYNACKSVPKDDLAEGDLVFFNTRGGVSHVGLYLANGFFVHSCSSGGVSINNLADRYYSQKFIGGGRMQF